MKVNRILGDPDEGRIYASGEAFEEAHEGKLVRLNHDQLLCLMAAIMLSGAFTFKDPGKEMTRAMKIAYRIMGRIMRGEEFTEWEEDEDLGDPKSETR
jgi:hypothetical protein